MFQKNANSMVFLLALAWLAGCSRPVNPISPYGAPPPAPATSTPTPVPTPDVHIQGLAEGYSNGVSISVAVTVNGVPDNSATVDFAGTGLNMNLPNITSFGFYMAEDFTTSLQPGQSYVLTVVSSSGTFATTIVCPGLPAIATDGSQVTWTPEGTQDRVRVQQNVSMNPTTYDSSSLSTDINSPFTIPATAYPTSGSYWITAWTANVAGFLGADSSSQFSVGGFSQLGVSK